VLLAEFVIRPAVERDSHAIRALIHRVQINPMGLDWRRFILAIGPDNVMAGCGQIKPHTDNSLELASIAVHPDFRGQGVARKIISFLLELEPGRPLFLMCRARLESFYVKFGFRVASFSELPRYFRRIKRLENIINRRSPADDRLLVMVLDGGSTG
jgi:amino-acid N-acetyltransferase